MTHILYWVQQQSSVQSNNTDQTDEEIDKNNLLFIALFAVGLAAAEADDKMMDLEISRLKLFLDELKIQGLSSSESYVQMKHLIYNPPDLDSALYYVQKLDNPDYKLFEELIEVVANSDGKFCHKEKKFLDEFRQKVGRTTVVPVIATMSSGKSTLINAMLGANILPSANQACTATVLKVENRDGAIDWQGRYLSSHEGVSKWQAIDSSVLSQWNKEDVLDIEVLGNFPHIDNNYAHLVIYDTPGPNNAMDRSHSEITHDILSGSNHACIICVLNAEQFGIDDELSLLSTIQKETKQNKTNVIFVVNKFDKLDAESEDIIEFIKKVRVHLCKVGFNKPVIIPLMSKLALELRILISAIDNGKLIPFKSRKQKQIARELKLLTNKEEQYISALGNNRLIETALIKCNKKIAESQKNYTIGDEDFSKQQLDSVLTITGIRVLEYLLTKNINTIYQKKMEKNQLHIELTYNPYIVETKIKVKGKSLKADDDLIRFCQNKRLQDWIDPLLDKFTQYRVRKIELKVNCTDLDSEDVEDAVNRFNLGESDTVIDLTVNKHAQSIDEKIEQLKNLYEEAQKGPFDEFRSEKLENNFNSALSPDYEVNVIATMSSGKSTVINAILGRDLMPSKNEACTATITRIQDSDENDVFVGKRLDREGTILDISPEVTKTTLEKWNEDERTSLIKLTGDIKTIKETKSARLVLIDTPGPNNSRDVSHRKTMQDAITSKPLSMVLYILNATQLNIDDDATLLKTVSEEMQAGGRKAQDRFIFILNKIDQFDPENGESVTSAIESAKKALNKNGIENPVVIPVSAELAKSLRMAKYQGESELTRKQRNALRSNIELFTDEDEMNMLRHVKKDINPLCYGHLEKKLNEANDANDNNMKAEILSGIPIVEKLFNEFLQKHALPAKIKDAVDSFRHVMAKAKRIEALNKQLEKGEEELKEAVKAVENFQNNGERINKAEEFRDKVNNRTYTSSAELEDSYKKIQGKAFELLQENTEDFQDLVERDEAEQKISKVTKECENFIMEIENTIKKALDVDFLLGLNSIRDDYEKYVSELLEKEFPSTDNTDLLEFQKQSMQMPEVEDLIEASTDEVFIGSKKVSDSSWWNPFSWGRTKTINTYGDRVDLSKIWDEISASLREAIQEIVDRSNEFAKSRAKEGKDIIIKSMDDIDRVLKENMDNMKMASTDKEEAEKQISENNKKITWYKIFDEKLNGILSISDSGLINNTQTKKKHEKSELAMS